MTQRFIICLCFVVFLAPLLACGRIKQCAIDPDLISAVEELRGLRFKSPPLCLRKDEKAVKAHFQKRLLERNDPKHLEYEELSYKMLGLLPRHFSYQQSLADAGVRRANAYYDQEAKAFVMLEDLRGAQMRATVVHELVHLLQDQYFGIEALLPEGMSNDRHLAALALIEGDAQRISRHYQTAGKACEILSEEDLLKRLKENLFSLQLSWMPLALRMEFQFPYLYGENYYCWRERNKFAGGIADEAPQTTAEIISPEGVRGKPCFKSIKEKRSSDGILYQDSLGQFTVFSLLATYLPLEFARRISSTWVADMLLLLGSKEPRALVWHTCWNSEPDSQAFYKALRSAFAERFLGLSEFSRDRTRFFTKEFSQVELNRNGRVVRTKITR